jgi:hypothetical protein
MEQISIKPYLHRMVLVANLYFQQLDDERSAQGCPSAKISQYLLDGGGGVRAVTFYHTDIDLGSSLV